MMMGGSKDAPPELLELFAGKQMGLADKARPLRHLGISRVPLLPAGAVHLADAHAQICDGVCKESALWAPWAAL